jgi:hypothetical protein
MRQDTLFATVAAVSTISITRQTRDRQPRPTAFERRNEWVGYPYIRVDPDNLEQLS